jgi:hypothetical protein
MLDLNLIFNQSFHNVSIIVGTVVSIGLAYKFYISYTEWTLFNRVRQVEAARALEGLPSDVTITPEDLRLNPDLADILGVTDVSQNINIALETSAHLDYLQFQETILNQSLFMDNVIIYFTSFFI